MLTPAPACLALPEYGYTLVPVPTQLSHAAHRTTPRTSHHHTHHRTPTPSRLSLFSPPLVLGAQGKIYKNCRNSGL
jgi:hypothetical protein